MKIIISLNKREQIYDYMSMGIHTYIIGGQYSFYSPYLMTITEIQSLINQYPQCFFYVAVNALYDQHLMDDLEQYIINLYKIGIKGIVFQDFGVLQIVKEHQLDLEMIYQPETLNTNHATLECLKDYGITGAFVSCVIPLEEQKLIKEKSSLPLIIQGHGVEYIAASKRHLLSNYKKASQLDFDETQCLTLQAHQSDYPFYVYEDKWGTHIFSKSRLYTLDLLNQLKDFDYWYIETMMMGDEEAIEIASLYSDALKSLEKGTYNKDIKDYMNLLYRLQTPLDRGFLFDQTVYKLEDMRKMDHEKSKSSY